jgi:hypothetical protein
MKSPVGLIDVENSLHDNAITDEARAALPVRMRAHEHVFNQATFLVSSVVDFRAGPMRHGHP